MERRRDTDISPPAPGELELVRSFLSVHDHLGSDPMSLPPSHASLREFFVEHGLIDPDELVSERSLRSASLVHAALHRKVEGLTGAESTTRGVAGALGRILAAAFLAQLDGTWERLKECSDDTCTGVFYDRSKNHSGKWCSMQSCGNRNKVRAWRARQHAGGPAA